MKKAWLCIVFALLCLGAGTVDDPDVIYYSPTIRLRWDNNATADQIEFVLLSEDGDPNNSDLIVKTFTGTDKTQLVNGQEGELAIWDAIQDLPDGIYFCYCRVKTEAGRASAWTSPAYVVKKDWRIPEPPGGCALVR